MVDIIFCNFMPLIPKLCDGFHSESGKEMGDLYHLYVGFTGNINQQYT